jgi:hypothetical protein
MAGGMQHDLQCHPHEALQQWQRLAVIAMGALEPGGASSVLARVNSNAVVSSGARLMEVDDWVEGGSRPLGGVGRCTA